MLGLCVPTFARIEQAKTRRPVEPEPSARHASVGFHDRTVLLAIRCRAVYLAFANSCPTDVNGKRVKEPSKFPAVRSCCHLPFCPCVRQGC